MHFIYILSIEFLETLDNWDRWLFLKINTELSSPLMDLVAPFLRYSQIWIPLYIFLLLLVFINFGKKAWSWLLFAIITVVITDQLSSTFMKNYFGRIRPCNVPELMGQIRLMVPHCSGGYSFTSSHAANHFGIGIYFFLTLKDYIGKWGWLFIFWAAAISYSQIYVGVHYPGDILGGTVIGLLGGFTTTFFFQRYFGMPELLSLKSRSMS